MIIWMWIVYNMLLLLLLPLCHDHHIEGMSEQANERTNDGFLCVYALKCKRAFTFPWMSWLNRCLNLPLRLTNLWYQEEKCNICNAICIIYRLSVCHTHYMHCHIWRQTSAYIVCFHAHAVNAHTSPDPKKNNLFTWAFIRIVNQTKCVRFTYKWMHTMHTHCILYCMLMAFFAFSISFSFIFTKIQMQTLAQLISNVMNIIASINEFIPILCKCSRCISESKNATVSAFETTTRS